MDIKKILLYACVSLMSSEISTNTEKTNKNSGTTVVAISGQTIVQKSQIGQKVQKKLKAEQEQLSKPLQEDEKVIRNKEQLLINKKNELDKEAEEITTNKLLSQDAKQRKFETLQDKVRILE